MNSQRSHLKKAQFTWPKNILMFTQKIHLQVLRIWKRMEGFLDSYFFKVIIINSEFQILFNLVL